MNRPSVSAAASTSTRSIAPPFMLGLVVLAAAALLMLAPAGNVSAQSGGIYLSDTSLYMDENGGWEYFTVSLTSKPDGYVGVNLRIVEEDDANFVVGVHNSYGQFVECYAGETCYIHINDDEWSDNQGVYVAALVDDNREGGSGKIRVSTQSGDSNFNGIEKEVSLTEYDRVGAALTLPDGFPSYVFEGGQASFSVKLGAEPYNDVTVAVAASGDDSFSVSPSSLTFTSSNFSSKQWVTVRAADDADGLEGRATISISADSTDTGYDGLARSFSIREVENDTARFVLSNYHGSLTITEGGQHTYSIRLDTEPTANVTIGVGVHGGDGDITVSPASLTFTKDNYTTAQSVTVTTEEDDGEYASETATITHSVSGAAEYTSLGIGNVSVTSLDDDRFLFIDTDPDTSGEQTTLALAEGGGSATYSVWLSNPPTGDVTVDLSESQNPTTGNVKVTSSKRLTFTTSNWDTKQTVRVRAHGDQDAINGIATINHAASGGGFDNTSNSVSVVERDSRAAIVIDADATRSGNQTSASVNEGGGASYAVALAAKPSSDVTVTALVSGDDSFSVSSSSLAFTPDNYDTAQTVTLSAAADDDLANGRATIAHDARGGGYDGVSTRNLSATEIDKTGRVLLRNAADTADATKLSVPEGGSATYAVKLNVQPTGSVTVRLRLQSTSGDNPGDRDISASPTTLYFNRNNWDQAKTVTLRAAHDDDYAVGFRTIGHTASGGGFNVTEPVTLTAAENDDEASFLFTDGNGDTVTGLMVPEGGSADYYLALSTAPAATVQVDLSAGGDGDITVSPSLVIFTTTNWDVAQKVTASAAEDVNRTNDLADISHVATSSDAVYAGETGVLATTEIENEPGILVKDADGWGASSASLDVREGGTATYQVKLNSPPQAGDVTVTITGKTSVPQNDPDLTVDTDPKTAGNQTTLTFDATNWDTARSVTVRAANDNGARKCDPSRVFTHAASGDEEFSSAPDVLLTATELDNDSRRIVLCDAAGHSALSTLIVPEGIGAAYSVKLSHRPSGNVTVNIRAASSGDTDITAEVASLSFTADNWNVAQQASLWAAEDTDLVSGSRTINHTASGHSSVSLLAVEQDKGEKEDSISAYDSTATTVLLKTVKSDPAHAYSYRSSPASGCEAASSFHVHDQLTPGTEYAFYLRVYSCGSSNARVVATSNPVTTKTVTLTSSGVTAGEATLSVSGWTHTKDGLVRDGDWRYKADHGPDATCSTAQAGASAALTGLDSGTTYTYTMYQGSDCSTEIETFPAFTTLGQTLSVDAGGNVAALSIPGYGSNWYHKHDGAGADCEGPVSGGGTGYVSGLSENTEYVFKAYSDSGCTSEIASKRARTAAPSLAASQVSASTVLLTLGGGYAGDWYYKSATAGKTDCEGPVSGGTSSARVTGLSKSTQYTFTAYMDGNCAAALAAAPAFTTLSPALAASGVGATSATLALSGWAAAHDGNWWYKSTTAGKTDCAPSDATGVSTDTVTVTGLSTDTQYTYTAYSDSGCAAANAIATAPAFTTLSPALVFSKVGTTTATLTLSGWAAGAGKDGNWWYKSTTTGQTACAPNDTTGLSSATVTVTGLSTSTQYTYTAYSDSGCATALDTAPAFTTLLTIPGTRNASKEFDTPEAADVGGSTRIPYGMWSDGTTLWLAVWGDRKLYAYNLADGTRATSSDITTVTAGSQSNAGITSDGSTLWVSNLLYNSTTTWAYKMNPGQSDHGARATSSDIALHSGSIGRRAIWTGGDTMWIMDRNNNGQLFAYDYSATTQTWARNSGKEFDLNMGNSATRGIWSDGVTMWVTNSDHDKVFAYTLATKARDTSKEFDLHADNGDPRGIWSDGTTMWISDDGDNKLYAYGAYPSEQGLTVTGTGATTATLKLLNYSGHWWYKSTTAGHTTCASVGSGTYTVSLAGLTKGTAYTFTAYSDGNCANVIATAPAFAFLKPALTAVNVGTNKATLKLANYTSDWWYKSTTAGHTTCASVGSGAYTVNLTGLTTGATYTFTAYGDSNCSNAIAAAAFITPEGVPGSRRSGKDIDTLSAAGNNVPYGMWSDGTTLWVVDYTDRKLYAYKLTEGSEFGERDNGKDVTPTGASYLAGVASDGSTMWLSRLAANSRTLWAYTRSGDSWSRATGSDITLHYSSAHRRGLWTDGKTMWMLDNFGTGTLYAYDYSNGSWSRNSSKEFSLNVSGGSLRSLWSDGVTMWVVDSNNDKVWAYTLATKTRDTSKEFEVHTDNGVPGGIWSDGKTMWIGDFVDDKVYAYYAPPVAPPPSLTATGVATTTATLKLENHTGGWWYNSTTTGHTDCASVSSGTYTVDLTGLTAGASYTFTGYSDGNCSKALAAAPTFTTTGATLALARVGTTTATLKLLGHTGGWWYKSTTTGQTACASVGSGTSTVNLSGLTQGASYTFTAYSDGNCSAVLDAAPAFTTPLEGDRDAGNDIAIDLTHGVAAPYKRAGQVWSDGTTIWVSEASGGHDLHAYTLATGAEDASKEIQTLHGHSTFTGYGNTIWVMRDLGATSIAYAYSISTGSRDESKNINLAEANKDAMGMTTDGETFWVADERDDRVYAYNLSTGARDVGKEFDLHADNNNPNGIWTDGALIWVTDWFGKVYAYRLADGSRVPGKDYSPPDGSSSRPRGIWSDGTTAWITDYRVSHRDKLYAYVAHPLGKGLRATSSATTARLELSRHQGSWYYKADTGPHTTCSVEQTGTAADLTGLAPGASYTYTAYSDNGCASEIAIAWPFTTNVPALTASHASTTATLALSGWAIGTSTGKDGNWHYKADSGPHATCSTAQTKAVVHLSGLSAGGAYTYTAYSDANCANVIAAASAFRTHAAAPALAAGDPTVTTMQLALGNYTGAWWYKYTVPASPAGTCTAVIGATSTRATGLTKSTNYIFNAYRAEGCASADLLATAPATTTATPTLRVSKIKSMSATLALEGWDPEIEGEGPWKFRGNRQPHNGCYGGGATRGEEIRIAARAYQTQGLTPNVSYTFTAYDGSCSGSNLIDAVTFTTAAALQSGEFDNGRSYGAGDLKTGVTDDHGHEELIRAPGNIWSDGTTLWLYSRDLGKLAAFNLSSKARDLTKDIDVGSVWYPVSVTGDGSTVWMGQQYLNRLWAYSLDTRARVPGKDITLHPDNGDRSALWTDGTTMWVADYDDEKLYAYAVSDGARQRDKEFDIPGAARREDCYGCGYAGAMWSDGTTLWFPGWYWLGGNSRTDSKAGIYAYKLSDGSRQPDKDYEYWWSVSPDNRIRFRSGLYPTGMWSNGATTWVSLHISNFAIAAYKAIPPTKRLEAGSVTGTSATLTLHWHTGAWWYERTAGNPADTTCYSVGAGTDTASLASLSSGQSYTYKAYDKTGCNSADEIASVTFTTSATAQGAGAFGASAQSQGGTVDTGLPVLRIDGAGTTTWEYTLPPGATHVSTELRWVETEGLTADVWTGNRSQVFTDGSVTGYAISGLQRGVEYKAQVTVSMTAGGAPSSATSATLVFTLPAEPVETAAPPGNIAWVMAVHNGDNVSALWPAASKATGYEARYSADGGASWLPATTTAVGTVLVIANTSSEKSYVVGVRATNASGNGAWTNSASVSAGVVATSSPALPPVATSSPALDPVATSSVESEQVARASSVAQGAATTSGPAQPTPGDVGTVTATHNGDSVVASWLPANRATGYDLVYSTDNKATWSRAATNHYGTSYTLKDADSAKTYIIGVRAVNAVGKGDWTDSAPASAP